jgi:hypothetical protein
VTGYDHWDSEFREVFDEIPGVPMFREYELNIAENLFYSGWIDMSGSPDERMAAREEFFDFTGVPEEDFPWADWREALYPNE